MMRFPDLHLVPVICACGLLLGGLFGSGCAPAGGELSHGDAATPDISNDPDRGWTADAGGAPSGMVEVPAGLFWMGCNEAVDDACQLDEFPYHEVHLNTFWINRAEVTNQEYINYLNLVSPADPGLLLEPMSWSSVRLEEGTWGLKDLEEPEAPVRSISWEGARRYCEHYGRRLCTEAEWEKAARGTDGRTYPWGNEEPNCNLCNMSAPLSLCGCLPEGHPDEAGNTQKVCNIPAGNSPYGACDMAGNVWEWVDGYYTAGGYCDGCEPTVDKFLDRLTRVFRGGGACGQGATYLGVARRYGEHGGANPGNHIGIRCCWDPGLREGR